MSLNGLKQAVEAEWNGAEIQSFGQSCGSLTAQIQARGWDEKVDRLVQSRGFEVVGVTPVDDSTVEIRVMEE